MTFFLHFRGFLTAKSEAKVWSARQKLYASGRHYPTKLLQKNASLQSFDATPYYLWATPPQRILCVCPWVKLVVLLRHPVDRAHASYQRAVHIHGYKGTFGAWVYQDLDRMREAGLVGPNRAKRGTLGEEDAWFRYLQLSKQGPVGQSLYELQLRHWFQAIRDMGQDPMEKIHFVRYEEWKRAPQEQYERLLRYLELPTQVVQWSIRTSTVSSTVQHDGAKEDYQETRQKLEKFYAPYNKRLYRLLGGDWRGCWDAP